MSYNLKKYKDLYESEVLSVEAKLRSQIDAGEPGDCHLWMGYVSERPGPYYGWVGLFVPGRGQIQAQRVLWALEHQVAPAEWRYTTSCGQVRCLNPDHLDFVEMDGEFVEVGSNEYFIASMSSETPGAQFRRQCA